MTKLQGWIAIVLIALLVVVLARIDGHLSRLGPSAELARIDHNLAVLASRVVQR